jgi:invasion protein IalB
MTTFDFQSARRFLPLAALAATVAMSAPATAEDAPPASPSKWVKVCEADPATEKQSCTVLQRIVGPTGDLVASVAIRQVAGDAKVLFTVSMPLGLSIKAGLAVKIDDKKALPLKFGICSRTACYAQGSSDQTLVNALKAGGTLTVAAKSVSDKAIALPITLTGFTKAYDGKGVDVATAETQFDQLAQLAKEDIAKAKARLAKQTGDVAAPAQ